MAKQIQDMPLKTGIDGNEDILIQDNGVTKRIKSNELINNVDLSDYVSINDTNKVTPEMTTFFVYGESDNLFDEQYESGAINSLGNPYDDGNYIRTSNFIEVKGNTKYTIYKSDNIAYEFSGYWYDENYAFINNGRLFPANSTANTNTVTSPTNAKYLKFRAKTTLIGECMIIEGTNFTAYTPKQSGTLIKEEYLPKTELDASEIDERLYALELRMGFKWREFDKGKVVFILDDGLSDISTITELMMNTYNFPTSYAIITNGLNNSVDVNNKGWKTVSDVLLASQEFGGEIFSHSVNSDDFGENSSYNGGYNGKVPNDVVEEKLKSSKNELKKIGLKVNGFISPRGTFMDDYLDLVMKYYRYAYRGSATREPYVLNRINIKQKSLEVLKTDIDNCAKNKSLLILMCHKVVDSNGEGMGIYSNGFSMNDFTAIMDYLKLKESELDVTTIREVYNQFAGV